MKTFWSILGGLVFVFVLIVVPSAAILFPSFGIPLAIGVGIVCALAVVGLLFFLGYDFTRTVILGGR